jgi:hypothetical protein
MGTCRRTSVANDASMAVDLNDDVDRGRGGMNMRFDLGKEHTR